VILLNGARIDTVTIGRTADGVATLEGNYSLIKEDGGVLAKQVLNGYSADLKLEISADLSKLIRAVSAQMKTEIETLLGLNEE